METDSDEQGLVLAQVCESGSTREVWVRHDRDADPGEREAAYHLDADVSGVAAREHWDCAFVFRGHVFGGGAGGLAGSNGGSPEAGATTSLGTKDGDEKVLMFMDSCTQEGQGPGNVWVGDNEAVQDRAKSINRRLCDKLTKKLLEFVLRRDRWRTLAPDLVAGEGADDADAWIFDEAI